MPVTKQDFEFNGTVCRGTVRAGTAVVFDRKANSFVVRDYANVAHFMSEHDWLYRYVFVPPDLVVSS